MGRYLNSRRNAVCALFILFSVLAQSTPVFSLSGSEQDTSDKEPRMVIVSMPRVTWKTLRDANTPNIDVLIERGSVASLSIRTSKNNRSIEKAYASLSAGNRALAATSQDSTFYAPDEIVNFRKAKDVFYDEQRFVPNDVAAVATGFEQTRVQNTGGLYPSDVGGLATELQRNHRSIAVFGNADMCTEADSVCRQRAVAYLGSDTMGVVRNGDISRDLLLPDHTLDMEKIEKKATESVAEHDVTVIECSNLERIDRERRESKEEVLHNNFVKALHECDELIGATVRHLDLARDRIFVLSPVSPYLKEQLTVFIAAGKDIARGYAVSGITRRQGIVAIADIAPSVLNFFHIEPGDEMVTSLPDWKESTDSAAERENALIRTNDRALIRDQSFNYVAGIFILIAFSAAVLALVAYRIVSWRNGTKVLLLMAMVMPTLTYAMLPLMLSLSSSINVVAAFVTLSLCCAGIAYYCGEKWGYVRTILGIVSINVGVQVIDIFTGGNLQLNSLFGYSAIVAGRFAGFGNLTFSIMAISSVVIVGMVQQLKKGHPEWNEKKINISLLLMMVAVLIVVGAPYFGSDVGGVLALTPTVFIIALMLYNKRIDIKSFLVAILITLGTISIFSLFDLQRPISERTHLGRFVQILLHGEPGAVIGRKVVSNFHILTNSLFASIVIIGTMYVAYLFLSPEKFLRSNAAAYPSFRYIVYPGLIVATLGMFLNDSGIAIPGMMLTIAFPTIALLAFEGQNPSMDRFDKQSDTTRVSEPV